MERLVDKFQDYLLNQEKASINGTESSRIVFELEGLVYMFEAFENDPYYFRITLPNVYVIEKEDDTWITNEIESLSIILKVARLIKEHKHVHAVADCFVYSTTNIDSLYDRILSCIRTLFTRLKSDYDQAMN